jgi:galactitol-specific phosphotransferase system IIB component
MRNERGTTTIEFIIASTIVVFFMMFPVAMSLELFSAHTVQRELDRALQIASVQGGVSSELADEIEDRLRAKGFEEVEVDSNALDTVVPKGEEIDITLSVKRKTASFHDGVMSLIGGRGVESEQIVQTGTILSEYLP